MVMDVLVLLSILLFAFLGYRSGLLRKLARIASLVVASLAAGHLAHPAARYAGDTWKMNSVVVYIACCVLAWLVLFFVGLFVLGRIAKKLGSGEEGRPRPWNRKLGALFGGLEVFALWWFAIGILDALPEDIRARRLHSVHEQMATSIFARVTHATNPAALLELQPLICDIAVIAENPGVLRGVARKPEIQELLQHPKVSGILADEALLEEWRSGRITGFFSSPKVRRALEDHEVRELLRRLPIRDILREAAREAPRAGD